MINKQQATVVWWNFKRTDIIFNPSNQAIEPRFVPFASSV